MQRSIVVLHSRAHVHRAASKIAATEAIPAAERVSATVYSLPEDAFGAGVSAVWAARLQEPSWATVSRLDDHHHCHAVRCRMGKTPTGSWRLCAHTAELGQHAGSPNGLLADDSEEVGDDVGLEPQEYTARGPRPKAFLQPPARVEVILQCARTQGLAASLADVTGLPEQRACVCLVSNNALIANYWERVLGRKPDHCLCGASCNNCGSAWNFVRPVVADKVRRILTQHSS